MQAVRSEVEANFARPEFSTEYLARKLGLSPRYMQELLQEEGASFTERVLELRLPRARVILADQRDDGRNVLKIALAAGFNVGPISTAVPRAFRRVADRVARHRTGRDALKRQRVRRRERRGAKKSAAVPAAPFRR